MRLIVPLATGFEEIEAVTIIDVLRRAEIDIISVFLDVNPVKGAHGISIVADSHIDDAKDYDISGIVLPGGMPGSENLKNDFRIIEHVTKINTKGGIVAAVCAAPLVLGHAGILSGKKATCFPGFEHLLQGAEIIDMPVVIDDNIITGRGPGCALPFALEIVSRIASTETARSLKDSMQVYWMG